MIYCDNHILVYEKPRGIATQDHDDIPGLESEAKAWVKRRFLKQGNVFLQPVHRLDKPVSGLVLFARTSKALSRLQALMRERKIEKTYVAKVDVMPRDSKGVLRHFLVHDQYRARIVDEKTPGAKEAILHYRQIEDDVLEITLVTGRYHQIRAQLAAIGSPIVGDQKYGSRKYFDDDGIALIHTRLRFMHPVTKESMDMRLD